MNPVDNVALAMAQNSPKMADASSGRAAKSRNELQSMVELANAAFSLRQKSHTSSIAPEQLRPLLRHIIRILECLSEIGLDIQDHSDQPFDSGMSLEVIALQPVTGLAPEKVIETIRPTVYLRGQRIQMGQVIVAVPEQLSTEGKL